MAAEVKALLQEIRGFLRDRCTPAEQPGSVLSPARAIAVAGASSAGVGIIAGIAGHVVLSSADRVLGLPTVSRDAQEYVRAGGVFLIHCVLDVPVACARVPWKTWLLVAATVAAALALRHPTIREMCPAGVRRGLTGVLAAALPALVLAWGVYAAWSLATPSRIEPLLVYTARQEAAKDPVGLMVHDLQNADMDPGATNLQARFGTMAILLGIYMLGIWALERSSMAVAASSQSQPTPASLDGASSPVSQGSGDLGWSHVRVPSLVLLVLCLYLLASAYGALLGNPGLLRVLRLSTSAKGTIVSGDLNRPLYLVRQDDKQMILFKPGLPAPPTSESARGQRTEASRRDRADKPSLVYLRRDAVDALVLATQRTSLGAAITQRGTD
ncbi:MAG: hypothetical protein NT029_14940 [Armatimonadetes bacterium]|nr:hypothetical protein [Armatimonadota bacterium]